MKKYSIFLLILIGVGFKGFTQTKKIKQTYIQVKKNDSQQKIDVQIDGKLFTSFCYPDSLEKPFLFPIFAPNDSAVTRGYPLATKPNDPTDHPHHIGMWFNYESVNGLDFWNNSFAIEAKQKKNYGWIRTNKMIRTRSGKEASITYDADWTDHEKNVLLEEQTDLIFSTIGSDRIIERITKLTAKEDVSFKDVKDGMLGLRVAHELELPIFETRKYTDDKGNITYVKANRDSTVTGNYITSEGKQGDAVWGTRAVWCMLYGKLGADSISIAIMDHPNNPGYPTYWHARNYGLFAANPLGQKIFSNGKNVLDYKLKKGQSTIFRYKIIIASGKNSLPISSIDKLAQEFAAVK